jgi:hypothetical protein
MLLSAVIAPWTRAKTAAGAHLVTFAAIAASAFFFAAGLLFVPILGIQNDEVLFGSALYPPFGVVYSRSVFHVKIPLMLMSYLGALKAWVYAVIWRVFAPSPYSLRIPVLLAGAVTIWLFWVLLCRVSGTRAALIGTVLLATDAVYLLTTCADWGPVAFQHLFLVGGMYLATTGRHRSAAFVFGLALWDKALFVWSLAGLSAGAFAVYPRQTVGVLRSRRFPAIVLCFVLGAFPLILFNVSKRLETFRNPSYAADDLGGKFRLLRSTLEGHSLFAWMVEDEPGPRGVAPANAIENASAWLSRASRAPQRTITPWLLLGCLAAFPFLRQTANSRMMLFSLVFLVVAWGLMGITANAGGGVHHVILLWPFPQLFVALVLGAVPYRGVAALATAAAALSNVLVLNQYYAQAVRNGGSLGFTDAIYTLAERVRTMPAASICLIDWGMLEPVRVLNDGRTPLIIGDAPTTRDTISRRVADGTNVFIAHTGAFAYTPEVRERYEAAAREMGLEPQIAEVIYDRNGRARFEILRFTGPRTPRTPDRSLALRPGA